MAEKRRVLVKCVALTFDKPYTLTQLGTHKGLITHKLSDLRRTRNVNMKYENEDGRNKSDERDSVGSFMNASIMALTGASLFGRRGPF